MAKRVAKVVAISSAILLSTLITGGLLYQRTPHAFPTFQRAKTGAVAIGDEAQTKLHVVLPANNHDINLCKLLLGCSLLGYPTPTLLAWEETFDSGGILGGGSHLAKVSRTLDYINSLDPSQDDDLILMLDAYDIHLQLPKSVLVDRYFETREATQKRAIEFAGEAAVTGENIQQLIVFGAGKRCAPNQPHTIACYPTPESPLPMDLYGGNTDTVIGHNHHYSIRQRYLNSGYILGPAGAMRRLFTEAWRLIQEHPDQDPEDDGSHGSDLMYHGSDQSIFAAMYGRQEWCREKLRLKHAPPGTKPHSSQVFTTFIDNVLYPSFHHERFEPDLSQGNPYEYGMYLDFWSDFGHQTINSEVDAHWIVYDGSRSAEEQVGPRQEGFDCPVRVPSTLPKDILESRVPTDESDRAPWLTRPLYTHVCTSRIPVLKHMNGDKGHREGTWAQLWYQPRARQMLKHLELALERDGSNQTYDEHRANPGLRLAGGAWSEKGDLVTWDHACPPEWDKEIFRDVE